MGLKPYLEPALAALLVCSAYSVLAQTVPAATQSKFHLAIGAGISGYNPDYGHGHLLGGTLWIDYTLPRMPHLLNGIGLEAEAHDLNYGRTTAPPAQSLQAANLREDVALGGLIYTLPRYRNFHPYAKIMMGYGNADEETLAIPSKPSPPIRWHDSRTVTSAGGGMDYRVFRNIWVRADYEYESWPTFFVNPGNVPPAGRLTPQGFTIGAMYHFGHSGFR
jgi:opacity protein-like surface antigen